MATKPGTPVPAPTRAELIAEVRDALTDYYDHPVTILDSDTYAPSVCEDSRRKRAAQSARARAAVAAAMTSELSARQLAVDTGLPGLLIIENITDTDQHAEACDAEIHHLQRTMDEVRRRKARMAAGPESVEELIMLARSGGAAREKLKGLVPELVPTLYSESEFARRVGVNRMTVRSWLGKR